MYLPWPDIKDVPEFAALDHHSLQQDAAAFPLTAVSNFKVPLLFGDFILGSSAFGASVLFFPESDDYDIATRFDYYNLGSSVTGKKMAFDVGLELMGYSVKEVKIFKTPVDLSYLTDFQQDILLACRQIPFGETATHTELAALAGHPGKGGAASRVLRFNPLPILIPCHRVLPVTRRLGSYCGHPDWKRFLLEHEGVTIPLPAA